VLCQGSPGATRGAVAVLAETDGLLSFGRERERSRQEKGLDMRKKLATLAIVCATGIGASIAGVAPAGAGALPRAGVHQAWASCVYGKIGGVRKCLRAGEYCARRYERQYLRYGFECTKLDHLGRWHLERT